MSKLSPLYVRAKAHIQKANLHGALADFTASFRALEPESSNALIFALVLLDKQGQSQQAMGLLEEAAQIMPNPDKWLVALAERHMQMGDYKEAIDRVKWAQQLNPENSIAALHLACWQGRLLGDCPQSKALFEAWGQRFMDPLTANAAPFENIDLSPNKRLRIGYVSGDLKNHSVRYFIEPYLKYRNQEQFEVHAFMTMPADEVTEWIKPWVDCWHDVSQASDGELFSLIRGQKIDVLVDLSGHTQGQRLTVFAMRAAPVQVTWFGFMQTLGMRAIDWRITDYGATPEGADAFYTEKLYRIGAMVAYSPPLNSEEQFESPWHANGYITMACLNHSRKISDEAIVLWARILQAHPNAGLMLFSGEKGGQDSEQISKRLERLGMPMSQVSLQERMTMLAFMRMASIADFAVDSLPVSGGTTTMHALWMGLPTITMDSTSMGAINGATASILKGVGLPGLVAQDANAYVNLVGQWIQEPRLIDEARARTRPALQSSALMAYADRVQEVEVAYRHMWQHFTN